MRLNTYKTLQKTYILNAFLSENIGSLGFYAFYEEGNLSLFRQGDFPVRKRKAIGDFLIKLQKV